MISSVVFILSRFLDFRASSMGECAMPLNGFSLFSDFVAILHRVSFILKIDQVLHTVPLTDFLPGSTCSAELGAAVVQVRLKSRHTYVDILAVDPHAW